MNILKRLLPSVNANLIFISGSINLKLIGYFFYLCLTPLSALSASSCCQFLLIEGAEVPGDLPTFGRKTENPCQSRSNSYVATFGFMIYKTATLVLKLTGVTLMPIVCTPKDKVQ